MGACRAVGGRLLVGASPAALVGASSSAVPACWAAGASCLVQGHPHPVPGQQGLLVPALVLPLACPCLLLCPCPVLPAGGK